MARIALVASRRDAPYAEAVLAGFPEAQARELVAPDSLARLTAPDCVVLLVWSAAFLREQAASGAAVDVLALIECWSQDRLVVVRKDETPMPLGLGDIAMQQAPPALACEAALRAVRRLAKGRGPNAPVMPADRRRDGGVAGSTALRVSVFVSLALSVAALAAWYASDRTASRAQAAARTTALELVAGVSKALGEARVAHQQARHRLERAQEAARRARTEGDRDRIALAIRAAEDAAMEMARHEALLRRVEASSPRSPAGPETGEAGSSQAIGDGNARRRAQGSAMIIGPRRSEENEPVVPAQPAATNAMDQGQALESDGRFRDAVRVYRYAARRGNADAALRLGEIYDKGRPGIQPDAEESRQWRSAAADIRKQAPRPDADSPMPFDTRRGPVLSPAEQIVLAPEPPETESALLEQGRRLESEGKLPEAVRTYRVAAHRGGGPAAKRLGEIYALGLPGIAADPIESSYWTELARLGGERVPPLPQPRTWHPAIAMLAIVVIAMLLLAWHWVRPGRPSGAAAVDAPEAKAPLLLVAASPKDKSRVDPILARIEALGYRIRLGHAFVGGEAAMGSRIARAVGECRALVLLASPAAFASDSVVRELCVALNLGKAVVHIEAEPAELPPQLQPFLAAYPSHRLGTGDARAALGRALAAV